jgi:hypothetical protein
VSDLRIFIAAAPQPYRTAMALLTSLGRRPRGRALLGRLPAIEQLSGGLLAMEHFEDPSVTRVLDFDAPAVAQRGRELRRSEGRP